ncbi:MAG: response regulator [Clostridiales bacterium]|nr:response regulator [Clostridiales bacterium]
MGRILVVDDEKSIRNTFQVFLSNEGHEVLIAENVENAIKVAKENDLDLVITDIIMPRNTGIDLMEKLKKIYPSLPIIIMTGEPTVETAALSVKNKAYDYITKPVDKNTLIITANNAVKYKQLNDAKKDLEMKNKEYQNNLEKLVEVRTESLQKAMNATVITMSTIIELRDPYTAGHERRVGNLAVEIAKKMKLSKKQLDCIYVTGYLHDIGKISVPAEILSKPGKLTNIEFEFIKTHVTYGYDVLKKVELPWPVANVVYQHHERMDGSGYPRGLKGDEIMIEAKIMAVADVVEAMTSHRPYRPSLGLDIALNEIETNKGKLYDEEVANATIELFKKDKYEIIDETKNIVFSV